MRIPEGIYRRLLAERLAQAFGFQRTPEGIAELLNVSIHREPELRGRKALSAGRGSLVRQAVRVVLNFPQIAVQTPTTTLAALSQLEEPGARLLHDLLAELKEQPAQTAGQVLERWRDRPEGAHLARLAVIEELVPDAAAAQEELTRALERLLLEASRRRLDRLLEKDRASGLSAEEKLELQRLTSDLARSRSAQAAS